MADPKIKVTADLSAVTSELGKLEAAAARINKMLSSGEVGINVKQAKADLESLNAAAKAVADSLTKIRGTGPTGDAGYAAVTKALEDASLAGESLEKVLSAVGQSTHLDQSIRASKAVADNLERATRAQKILTREGTALSREQAMAAKRRFDEWRVSGARGTTKLKGLEFDEWLGGGWRKYSIDFAESERNRQRVMRSLGVAPPQVAAPGGPTRGWGMGMGGFGRLGGVAAGGLAGMAGAALTGGGEGFFGAMGAAGGALLGAAVGTIATPGVGTFVGALSGGLLGAIGGVLDQSMRRVLATAENFTDLRHSIGASVDDFDKLRDAVVAHAAGLRLTNEQASKLARTFSDTAGTAKNYIEIAQGLKGGVGLARAYGLEPSVGVEFYGSMLRTGTTATNEQNKRLALMIGEAVARNGVSPQMGAILRAVQNFADVTTRASFTQANAAGYVDYLSRMMSTGLPGSKDVGAVTGAMTAADAALRQGGGFGLGSKVFSLGMYQRMLPGFNAFHLNIMQGQGAFGTVGNAFGPGSQPYRAAQRRGDTATMRRYEEWARIGGNKTQLELQLEQLQRTWPNASNEQQLMYIQNQFGLSVGQAQAVLEASQQPGGLGQLQRNLKAIGVPLEKVNTQQVGQLAAISGMSREQLRTAVDEALKEKNLPANIRGALENAQKSGDEGTMRGTLLKIAATMPRRRDEGEIMKQQAVDIQNLEDSVTKRLVPLVSDIQRAMIALLQKMGVPFKPTKIDFGGAVEKADEWMDRAIDKAMGTGAPTPGVGAGGGGGGGGGGGWSGRPNVAKMSAEQRGNMNKIIGWAKEMGANAEETAALLGVSWRDDKFRSVHGGVGTPGKGFPFGLFQVMDDTARGWGLSHHSDEAQKQQMRVLLREYRKQGTGAAGARAAGTAQLSGPRNVGAGGHPKVNRRDRAGTSTESFSGDVYRYWEDFKGILGSLPQLKMPTPNPMMFRSSLDRPPTQQVDVRHQITLIDRYGNQIPNALVDTTTFGPPTPAGIA